MLESLSYSLGIFMNTQLTTNLLEQSSIDQLTAEIEPTLDKMVRYILHTFSDGRVDRLWPSHFLVFATNPMNVAYGACGPLLFLQSMDKEIPTEIIHWLLKQPLSTETYPPGLYMGLAGIACTFQEIGLTEKAESTMEMLYQSPLLYKEPGIFLGAAGWGLVSLNFFLQTKKRAYLEKAVSAGEHLLKVARESDGIYYWQCNQDEKVHYGFGYGSSGISLFLLYLSVLTRREDFRLAAIGGLEFDLSNRVESAVGWQWKRFQDDTLLYPYWIHGSAGIASVLIRFYRLLGTKRYLDLACEIANDTFIKYSFIPSLFEGLAGIGELMIDMYQFTGSESYRNKAYDIADTISWFKIDRPQGIAYPGRWLTKISNDYATGSAGIGLFFSRLFYDTKRIFVDLDIDAEGGGL